MQPKNILKLTEAQTQLTQAERARASAAREARAKVNERYFDLEERYDAEDVSLRERLEIGDALRNRTRQLLANLFEQEEVEGIKDAFSRPDLETKSIDAPGYVVMDITHYKKVSPHQDNGGRPAGHIELTSHVPGWGLFQNDHITMGADLKRPIAHARLEDDIATLEELHTALELPIPEQR